MGRLSERLAELQSGGEKALVTYAMTGFPTAAASADAVAGMIRGGADVIEMGFPFSDPLADGPAIQEAATTALRRGATFEGFLRAAKRTRRANPDTPLVLMTYTNIMYNIGYEDAARKIAGAGIDGVILPDMAVDESVEYAKAARGQNLETVFLASPNTSQRRLRDLVRASSGFLYLVAVYGTTGVRNAAVQGSGRAPGRQNTGAAMPPYTAGAIRRALRAARGTSTAIGVGFGVSGPADVSAYVRAGADAVIVGSAYTRIIRNAARTGSVEADVAAFTRKLKAATRVK